MLLNFLLAVAFAASLLQPHAAFGQRQGTDATQAADVTYDVLHVRGTVQVAATREPLHPGFRVSATDTLRFSSVTDRVHVVSPQSGRLILQPDLQRSEREIIRVVRNILLRPMQRRALSTRSTGGPFSTDQIRLHFEQPLLLLGPVFVPSPAICCPETDTSFFYVRYRWNGEIVNKRLPRLNGRSILHADSLYRVDDRPISPSQTTQPELFYYEQAGLSYPISPLQLLVPDEEKVRTEVAILLRNVTGDRSVTNSAVVEDVAAYLEDTRSGVDRRGLRFWLAATYPSPAAYR